MPFIKQKHNYKLEGDGFFINYNPNPGAEIASFRGDNRSSETALVEKAEDRNYRILNGDFRKEYEELAPKGFEACLEFYDKMAPKYNSTWSTI